ncbi:translation initiation factor IF-2-like [Melopsittacus undulatus]|uniref:translation initiation factor IF-2-like n=1 Tax=Melopsittacus undulatus TaxID=13146 RepID=UPI00146A28B5|nr:translation initiation factor IF-2-like [Melopsittacus undulatus]
MGKAASSSSAPSSSSSSPQGGGRRRGEEEEKRKKDHRPLAAAPSPSNTTLQKKTHRQRQGWGGGGGDRGKACAGSPAPLASSSPVANGCRKGSCKDEEVAGCPPSGAGRGADPTAAAEGGGGGGRSRPLPPSAYLPPSRTAEYGWERWRRAERGLPGLRSRGPRAMRGAESQGEKIRARRGLPLRLCEGGEGSEELPGAAACVWQRGTPTSGSPGLSVCIP